MLFVNKNKSENDADPTFAALNDMQESEFTFYLTGSRFFEFSTPTSDYDFFVKNSREVNQFLADHGFVILNDVYGADYAGSDEQREPNNVASVFSKGMVHVQLVENPDLKNKIQEAIRESGFMGILKRLRITKKNMIVFWNLLYKVAALFPEEKVQKWFEENYRNEVEIAASQMVGDNEGEVTAAKVEVPEVPDEVRSLANNLF